MYSLLLFLLSVLSECGADYLIDDHGKCRFILRFTRQHQRKLFCNGFVSTSQRNHPSRLLYGTHFHREEAISYVKWIIISVTWQTSTNSKNMRKSRTKSGKSVFVGIWTLRRTNIDFLQSTCRFPLFATWTLLLLWVIRNRFEGRVVSAGLLFHCECFERCGTRFMHSYSQLKLCHRIPYHSNHLLIRHY